MKSAYNWPKNVGDSQKVHNGTFLHSHFPRMCKHCWGPITPIPHTPSLHWPWWNLIQKNAYLFSFTQISPLSVQLIAPLGPKTKSVSKYVKYWKFALQTFLPVINFSLLKTINNFTAPWTLSGTTRVSWYQKVHFAIFWIFWCKMRITQANTNSPDGLPPSRLTGAPISAIPTMLRQMPFLAQHSQFILAWDRHQICWLVYPLAHS